MLNALDVSAACDAIAEATGEFGIKIIVPDTLARNFGDGDENSTGDMNRFVSAVGRMIERFGCAVVVVHHSWHGDIMPAKHSDNTVQLRPTLFLFVLPISCITRPKGEASIKFCMGRSWVE